MKPFPQHPRNQCNIDTVGKGGIINLTHIMQHVKHGQGCKVIGIQTAYLSKQLVSFHRSILCKQVFKRRLQNLCLIFIIYFKGMELPAFADFLRERDKFLFFCIWLRSICWNLLDIYPFNPIKF